MTDQPDVAADTAPDHGYADDTDAVTSAPAEEHQPSEHSAPSEPSEITESSSDPDGEPTGVELAAALAFQLQRLEAMQKAGQAMMDLPQLGRDSFLRGAPEPLRVVDVPVFELSLYELLKAYGTHPGRKREAILQITPLNLFSMDDALKRIGDFARLREEHRETILDDLWDGGGHVHRVRDPDFDRPQSPAQCPIPHQGVG